MIGLVVAVEDEVESLGIFRCRQQNRIMRIYTPHSSFHVILFRLDVILSILRKYIHALPIQYIYRRNDEITADFIHHVGPVIFHKKPFFFNDLFRQTLLTDTSHEINCVDLY